MADSGHGPPVLQGAPGLAARVGPLTGATAAAITPAGPDVMGPAAEAAG